jgi:hypothetical protein
LEEKNLENLERYENTLLIESENQKDSSSLMPKSSQIVTRQEKIPVKKQLKEKEEGKRSKERKKLIVRC